MGFEIFENRESGEVCFVCNTSGCAFGPIMESMEHSEGFVKWLGDDPRRFDDLEARWCKYAVLIDERGMVRWHSEGVQEQPPGAENQLPPDVYTIIEAVNFSLKNL